MPLHKGDNYWQAEEIKRVHIKPGERSDLTIVTMTNASPSIVRHFVEDHLLQGVSKIEVYFDGPTSLEDEDLLRTDAVSYHSCDTEFWKSCGFDDRPKHVEKRQLLAFQSAYASCVTRWIGFGDIDERFVPVGSFQKLLGNVRDEVEEIRAGTWECIWPENAKNYDAFTATHCRPRITDKEDLEWLGRRKPLFHSLSRLGLVGHPYGKFLVRSGIENLHISLHGVRKVVNGIRVPLKRKENALTLLHYDAIGLNEWMKKFKARLEPGGLMGGQASHRKAITQLVTLSTDSAFRVGVFEALYGFDRSYFAWLKKRGAIRKIVRTKSSV